MQNQVKVPKEIQELFIEAEACNALAIFHTNWLIPSPKALYYTIRKAKVNNLAWRALARVFPQMDERWTYHGITGIAHGPDEPELAVPKKPRAQRKPRVAAVAAVGESK